MGGILLPWDSAGVSLRELRPSESFRLSEPSCGRLRIPFYIRRPGKGASMPYLHFFSPAGELRLLGSGRRP